VRSTRLSALRGPGWLRAAIDEDPRLYAAKVVALAGVYYGAAKLGLELAFETPSVTAVWPPTGIALAALMLGGYRLWPGVALGAFLANSWTGVPVYAVVGIAAGNTLEAVVGTYLLRRVEFRPSLERVRDVLSLAVLAAVVSTTVSATFGVTSLLAADEIAGGDYGSVWRTWWLGDMGGDLVVAPALLVVAAQWPFRELRGRVVEAAALVAATAGIAVFMFTRSTSLTFLIFPVLVWAALRFWRLGAVVAILLFASIAIPLTESDMGPFSGEAPDDRLLLAQLYIGVAGLTALVLAAVVTQRQHVEDSLEHIASTLQESLLPHPPEIPGVEVAVDFRPVGERHLVGGDFYDWFRNDDGTWAVTIGDVVGKGPAAAATAALARHTLRMASIQEPRPSRILQFLNDAVLRESPGQTCTVVYARIDLHQRDRSRVVLSVGGHPPPLVLRYDGTVEPVGRGNLLGVSDDPELADYGVDLAPGDALVLHTDGLTDATPGRVVSAAELSVALASCAGQSARGIVHGLERMVLPGDGAAEPRDDIVVLVLRIPALEPEPRGWWRRFPDQAGARERG
jgi:integral membrane sensor domain MASE1